LVVVQTIASGTPYQQWLIEKEEEEWFSDGNNEHLRVRFITSDDLQDAVNKRKPPVDLWDTDIDE